MEHMRSLVKLELLIKGQGFFPGPFFIALQDLVWKPKLRATATATYHLDDMCCDP